MSQKIDANAEKVRKGQLSIFSCIFSFLIVNFALIIFPVILFN